jgi:hypothetical protein
MAVTRTTRAEQVRRRRQQQNKQRYDVSRAPTSSLRSGPLVSKPRRSPSMPPSLRSSRTGGSSRVGGSGRRAFAIALPAGIGIRLPTLPRVRTSWRLASALMVFMLGAMLLRLLSDRGMFIDGVNLGGAALVPGEEIYAASGIAGQNVFWVDPADVQRRIAAVPGIASASVGVEWPATVTILVTERIPVVTWLEGTQRWWVDADGQKFEARAELPGLLPVTVDDIAAGAVVSTTAAGRGIVPVLAVQGALQLRQLRPNIEMLHYDSLHGLSYADGRGWRGYFGVGTDMPQKLAVYEKLVDDLVARGIQPKTISVETVRAPYYSK